MFQPQYPPKDLKIGDLLEVWRSFDGGTLGYGIVTKEKVVRGRKNFTIFWFHLNKEQVNYTLNDKWYMRRLC